MIFQITSGSLAIILIGYIIFSILFYRKKKGDYEYVLDEYKKKLDEYKELLDDHPTIPVNERISATTELLAILDELVTYNLVNNRRYDILLKQESKDINFDNVIQDVSQEVFESIRPDIFTDTNNILTETALMSYIQKKVFFEYFTYLQNKSDIVGTT